MPLYEFRCPNGHDFEKFYRSISSASSEEKCPGCGAMAVRRISATGLVFKGSGFYITDYGKDGKKAERAAAASSAAKPTSAETRPSTAEATPAKPAESSSGSEAPKAVAEPRAAATPAKPAATPRKS